MEFQHQRAVEREMALESTDAVEAFRPDSFADKLRRQVLLGQQLAPNPHHQHVFLIGSVEDAYASAGRQAPRRPPQKIGLQILRARMPEGVNLTALRIETAMTCLMTPSLPAASMPWRMIRIAHRFWA